MPASTAIEVSPAIAPSPILTRLSVAPTFLFISVVIAVYVIFFLLYNTDKTFGLVYSRQRVPIVGFLRQALLLPLVAAYFIALYSAFSDPIVSEEAY